MSKRLALAGPFAAALLAGGCGDIMISISTDGRIEVFVSTTGAGLDLDGFSVSVDGGVERIVPSAGAVTLTDLREGAHSVRLSGLGDNCRVEGSNPRSVEVGAGGTVSVAFEVRCAGPRQVASPFCRCGCWSRVGHRSPTFMRWCFNTPSSPAQRGTLPGRARARVGRSSLPGAQHSSSRP